MVEIPIAADEDEILPRFGDTQDGRGARFGLSIRGPRITAIEICVTTHRELDDRGVVHRWDNVDRDGQHVVSGHVSHEGLDLEARRGHHGVSQVGILDGTGAGQCLGAGDERRVHSTPIARAADRQLEAEVRARGHRARRVELSASLSTHLHAADLAHVNAEAVAGACTPVWVHDDRLRPGSRWCDEHKNGRCEAKPEGEPSYRVHPMIRR